MASQDTQRSQTDTQSGSMTIAQTVWGSAGGPTVNASLNSSKQQDKQTTHNNSTLTANNLNIATTGDTTIIGGNLHGANAVNMVIGGDLTLESVQDRFSGSNKGMGISGGMSLGGVFTNENGAKANSKEVKTTAIGQGGDVSSVNGGVNASNGRYQKTETVLSSITGGTVDVSVDGNTQLTGALLAAVDAEGNDTGNLSLSTDSLNTTDLTNRSYSSNQSVGVNANVGVSDAANPADPNQSNTDLALNSSNYSYQNENSQSLDKTLATIGEGSVSVNGEDTSPDGVNRDVALVNKEIYNVDRQQGNIELTVDHRLLSEDGRKEIAEDVKGVAEKIVAAKREIQTWGDQVPPELQTLLPEFETMVEAAILEGRDIEPLKELFEDPNLIASVKNFAPLANLADTDPELLKQQLKEGIAVSVAPNEQGEDVLHITVKGTGNVPAVTQMVDGINSLMKVAESVPEDAAKVMEMALVAAGGAASIVMEVTTEVAAQTEAGQTLLTKVNTGLETLGNVVGSVAAGSDTLDEFVQDVAAEKQHQDSDYYRSMQGGVMA
ncbi:hemagglutinin repeat-containing protein [Salinimonas marina]|uniref:Hemagglutinin repeat-containing protein n=1 Tax=Salinimonas marina TaxID=2785918 RepID=A0A7S9E092_9ALTE|nr:hemagglutinin repeat-containing protein [Salinimonas marina]QPG07196.1 hemagglutinin repeat-containing protein [Salinimonas marina]